jgi:hypothetical protein
MYEKKEVKDRHKEEHGIVKYEHMSLPCSSTV